MLDHKHHQCMNKLLTYLVYSNTHSAQFMACLQHQVQQYKWKIIMNKLNNSDE